MRECDESTTLGVVQVLEQCQRWCPDPERLFTSVGPQIQSAPASASSRAPEGSPAWGWDHLKFSGGDSLNPGETKITLSQKQSSSTCRMCLANSIPDTYGALGTVFDATCEGPIMHKRH